MAMASSIWTNKRRNHDHRYTKSPKNYQTNKTLRSSFHTEHNYIRPAQPCIDNYGSNVNNEQNTATTSLPQHPVDKISDELLKSRWSLAEKKALHEYISTRPIKPCETDTKYWKSCANFLNKKFPFRIRTGKSCKNAAKRLGSHSAPNAVSTSISVQSAPNAVSTSISVPSTEHKMALHVDAEQMSMSGSSQDFQLKAQNFIEPTNACKGNACTSPQQVNMEVQQRLGLALDHTWAKRLCTEVIKHYDEDQVSEMNASLPSVMEELAALMKSNEKGSKIPKPGKKKIRKRRISLKGKHPEVEEGEPEEFIYSWPKCSCGVKHPPIPSFQPPDGVRCMFYWQIADQFPFMTLHRALTTELKFINADADQSGLIEMCELRGLLKSTLGEDVSDLTIEGTFNEIDTDKSGTLDFLEVLTVVDSLVQRRENTLPLTVKNEYSKVCVMQ
ncbi:uncharacterized protein LOC127871752 isoform X2 [Dreissena polymorpha]|uniref:uncharacterized protein LOC127871752 isoform X2 n=1 Tax=Dreissena polymorpha TaxID=45954 RepID=UPI0022648DF9|nr:uncharacterized protein LOC127871752 isoform X2 [Dreissena polymorpha]